MFNNILTYTLGYFSISITYRLKYYCVEVGIYSDDEAAARPAAKPVEKAIWRL